MLKKHRRWYQYCGAIHMHTVTSDGTKTLEEVVALGRQVGLEFMMFTDHMNLINRDEGKEGIYGDTLVVVGYEHNDVDEEHHYLVFDSPRVYPEDMSPPEYVAAAAADNALGIIAHPDEVRDALPEHPPYPWRDWSTDRFDGIEVWNQLSEWTEKLTRYNKLIMAFSPRKSLVSPTDRVRRRWDDLNMQRKVVGIAGVDAHAFQIKAGPFTVEVFPYKVHFRSLRCFVYFPEKMNADSDEAKGQLYDAIRDARLYFANVRWGAADKFEFYGQAADQMAICGQSLPLTDDASLHVKLPKRADLRLVHNGTTVVSSLTDRMEYRVTKPGIYRVEAYKGKHGWIFSNHIRVEGEGGAG